MSDTPASILRSAEGILGVVNTAAASALPKPWGYVLSAVEAAVGLAADLFDHGLDPSKTITAMRSSLPDVEAARREVDALIASKTASGR